MGTLSTAGLSPAFNVQQETCILIVPTGITVAQGGLYIVDKTVITNQRYTTIAAVTTASLTNGAIFVVCEDGGVVGGTTVTARFTWRGNTMGRLEGTVAIVASDYIKGVNASSQMVKAATAADQPVGIALAAQGAAGVVQVPIFLFGRGLTHTLP